MGFYDWWCDVKGFQEFPEAYDISQEAFEAGKKSNQDKINVVVEYILDNQVEVNDFYVNGKIVNLIETEELIKLLESI